MPDNAPTLLFCTAYAYLAGNASFDELFGVALAELPQYEPSTTAGELAGLIVSLEAEVAHGDYTEADAYQQIAAVLSGSIDDSFVQDDRPYSWSSYETSRRYDFNHPRLEVEESTVEAETVRLFQVMLPGTIRVEVSE